MQDSDGILNKVDVQIRPALKAEELRKRNGVTAEEYEAILQADRMYRQEEDLAREDASNQGKVSTMQIAGPPQARDDKRLKAERAAARARLKEERRRHSVLLAKQEQIEADMLIWERKILPRWPEVRNSKAVQELCRRGIPPSIRGRAWRLLIGNNLKITPDVFERLLIKAKQIQQTNTQPEVPADTSECDRFEAEYEHIRRLSEIQPSAIEAIAEELQEEIANAATYDDDEANNGITGINEEDTTDANTEAMEASEVTPNPSPVRGTRPDSLSDEDSSPARDTSEATPRRRHGASRANATEGDRTENSESSSQPVSGASTSDMGKENTVTLIGVDLPRTFPHLAFFHDGGPMAEGLEKVLQAYACFRADLGYVQGMSYLAAFLLLYMEPVEAFICLANMLAQDVYFQFYRLQPDEVRQLTFVFDVFFQDNLPLLYAHLQEQGVQSEMFLIDWLLTLYSKVLPLEATARVWDGFLFEGEIYSIRVALGILKYTAPRIGAMEFVEIRRHLTRLPEDTDEEELFEAIASIKIPRKKFNNMLGELREQWAAAGKITLQARHTMPGERRSIFRQDSKRSNPSSPRSPRQSSSCVVS